MAKDGITLKGPGEEELIILDGLVALNAATRSDTAEEAV